MFWTAGIVRIKSGYELRNITQRTEWADGTDVDDGPAVDSTYFLGYFREDYGFISHPGEEDYLDEHNGRFCVTPEYPNGTYAYFATVDENWNSSYPYVVGPTFYGVTENRLVTSVDETTTIYTAATSIVEDQLEDLNFNIFPNPSSDLIAIQANGLLEDALEIELVDLNGRLIRKSVMKKGSTITYFDVQTVYAGMYLLHIKSQFRTLSRKIMIEK